MSVAAEKVLVVRRLRAASIFKLFFFGLTISFVLLGIIFGIAGFFGADSVKWNNQPIHGAAALFAGPAVSLFVALLFTGFLGALSCFGLWLFSLVRPISIRFVPEPNKSLQPITPTDRAPGK